MDLVVGVGGIGSGFLLVFGRDYGVNYEWGKWKVMKKKKKKEGEREFWY